MAAFEGTFARLLSFCSLMTSTGFADTTLKSASRLWVVVAVAGQLIFAFYVAILYGRGAVRGDWISLNTVMPHGYVPADTMGNFAAVLHLLSAFVILAGGAIQLLPVLRSRAPGLHRWSGRLYMVNAIAISLGGLYMVWTRGTVGGLSQHLSISLNAVLLIVCAAMAWRHALACQFGAHRRWALRLFLVASGVWFFRVGLMLWLLIHRRPVGFDPHTFQGPFLTFLASGSIFCRWRCSSSICGHRRVAQRRNASRWQWG
jgi:uncharacterized membrane protein